MFVVAFIPSTSAWGDEDVSIQEQSVVNAQTDQESAVNQEQTLQKPEVGSAQDEQPSVDDAEQNDAALSSANDAIVDSQSPIVETAEMEAVAAEAPKADQQVATSESAQTLVAQSDNAQIAAQSDAEDDEQQDTGVSMHRLYNPNSGEHFYTASTKERDGLVTVGWKYEGVGWIAPSTGVEVHRLYNPNAGDHHYTTSVKERDSLVKVGWRYEGIGWLSGGNSAVLRQYNPHARTGTHNFTVSQKENDGLVKVGWRAEGIGWYALADTVDTLVSRYAVARATVSAGGKDMQVQATLVDDTYYLCLPSFADMTSVRLSALYAGEELAVSVADWNSSSFKDVVLGTSVNVAALSTVAAPNGACLLKFKPAGSSAVQKVGVMVSNAISSVYVNSVEAAKGRAYVEASEDHSAKANVCVTVVNASGELVYDKDSVGSSSTIKGRGNSTWGIGDKKPYQISLNKKADLLETGVKDNSQKKWLLLANANDATLLHNTIAYNLGLELGLTGTECAPVDLYYDGTYRGSYLLCEKVEVKNGRVNISDLEEAIEKANPDVDLKSLPVAQAVNQFGFTYQYVVGVADPDDITGGYLLEIDGAYYADEACWFESSWGPIVVKSPEFCSKTSMGYISQYVERAISRLIEGKSADNPGNSNGALFDLDSLAETYIVSEYAKNIDAFHTSTYLYKDAGATPLYTEPFWDFDASMGVRSDWTDTSFLTYQGFVLPHVSTVSTKVFEPVGLIEAVQDRARELWAGKVSPLISNTLLSKSASAVGARGYLHSIAYYRQQIAASQRMDEVLFGLTAFDNEIEPFATYDLNFNYLKSWLTWRVAWINDNIWRIHDGVIENAPYKYAGVDLGLVFDAGYYRTVNSGIVDGLSDAMLLWHFYSQGMTQGLVASRNFDVSYYKLHNADLHAAYGADMKKYYLHYIENGFKEGRVAV